MIRSGLDWSGDPGDPRKDGGSERLVIAIATCRDSEVETTSETLREIRLQRGLPEAFVFKHDHTRPEIRHLFFQELSQSEIECFALVIQKGEWSRDYLRNSNGPKRIVDGIVSLVAAMPDRLMAGQILLVDAPKTEIAFVGQIRGRIRENLASANRASFAKVKAVPDHRLEAFLVQTADMVAGALSIANWIEEGCPPRLKDKICLI